MLNENLENMMMITFFISIFGMFFFCAIKPKVSIARWFYLLFGISILALIPKLMEDIESKWLIIWPILFSLAGILPFIGITNSLKDIKGTEKEEELNKKFQEISIKNGKRRVLKYFLKNK